MNPRTAVFQLTNSRRHDVGRRSLKRAWLLDRSAQAKARKLARTEVLAHGAWWKLIDRIAGRSWRSIGENIARARARARARHLGVARRELGRLRLPRPRRPPRP